MKNFLLILLLCFAYVNAESQVMNITYKSIKDSSTELRYSINADYPQVDFGAGALMGVRGIASDINNSLDTTVSGIIKNFKAAVSEMPSEVSGGNESLLDISGKGWISNSSLLSVEMTVFNYVAGMAHPLTTVTGFNYDNNGAGPFSISDLFNKNSEYLNYLSAVSIRQLTENAEKEGYDNISDMIHDGASADIKNFDNWVTENDSLIIIFKPYQVGPYVMGIQSVSIPLSDLTAMIDPKGPLSFMMR
ncbi:MAG TPA: RsiV family protein [Ignavibacteria bacterium]|nr:RsiV family protein [Ignavibacteria bacterium]